MSNKAKPGIVPVQGKHYPSDEWIPSNGQRPDLPGDTLVDVKFLDGYVATRHRADFWRWMQKNAFDDITHFRIHQPAEQQPEIHASGAVQPAASTAASVQQVGGKHYSAMPDGYQPFQISKALGLNPVEHTVLKYLLRHARKNGKQDLLKAKHCLDILIEQEYPNE